MEFHPDSFANVFEFWDDFEFFKYSQRYLKFANLWDEFHANVVRNQLNWTDTQAFQLFSFTHIQRHTELQLGYLFA